MKASARLQTCVVVLILCGLAMTQPTAAAQSVDNSQSRPPVSKSDIEIVKKARQILNSPQKWNRIQPTSRSQLTFHNVVLRGAHAHSIINHPMNRRVASRTTDTKTLNRNPPFPTIPEPQNTIGIQDSKRISPRISATCRQPKDSMGRQSAAIETSMKGQRIAGGGSRVFLFFRASI